MTTEYIETSEVSVSSTSRNLAYGLGDFTLYPASQALYKKNIEVTIEPKVFEVLVYLCQHSERYIQIHELHENIWKGRVVSDAAVRRTISKLRHILDDNGNQYIKSVHKRGYKIVAAVRVLEGHSLPNLNENTSDESFNAFTPSEPEKPSPVSKRLKLFSTLFVICAVSLLSVFYFAKSINSFVGASQIHLLEFPGEKTHAVSNDDGSLIAFAGKVIGSQGFQLFVSTPQNGDVKQLTTTENNIVSVGLSGDQKSVLFIDMVLGNSSIKRLPIKGVSDEPEVLLDGYYLISDLAVDPNHKGVYFSALKTKNNSSQIYYFDFKKKKATNITSGYRNDQHDYKVAVSKDGSLLAVSTVTGGGEEHKITVYNTKSRSVVKRFFHNRPIYYLSWMNSDRLLVLDKQNVLEILISSGAKQNVLANEGGKITSISAIDDSNVIILKESPSESLFMEVSIPSFDIASQRMIAKSQGVIREALYFANGETILFNESRENENVASVKRINESAEQILLKTVASMNVIDASSNGSYVLLKLGGTLALLNKNSSEIIYIAGGSQFVSIDATFSADSENVFYGEKIQQGWVIKQFHISTKEEHILFMGFKSIREIDGGYLMIDEEDQVHKFDTSNKQILALSIDLMIDENTRWFVREEYIYWSKFDGKNSFFKVMNLETKEINNIQFAASQIDTRFDINQEGTKALIRSSRLPETDILELRLP